MKKVKQAVLDRINNPASRNRIALALDRDSQSVAVQIRKNTINGSLTKMNALEAISEETGLPIADLLEDAELVEQK